MKQNMGTADRVIRVLVAIGLAVLYYTGNIANETLATVAWIAGIVFLFTAALGFCPLYTLFRLNTCKKS